MLTAMTTFSFLNRGDVHPTAAYPVAAPAGKPGFIPAAELDRLRIELRDSAAEYDRRGQPAASDAVAILAARLDELIDRAGSTGPVP